jgi:hypothetical protein
MVWLNLVGMAESDRLSRGRHGCWMLSANLNLSAYSSGMAAVDRPSGGDSSPSGGADDSTVEAASGGSRDVAAVASIQPAVTNQGQGQHMSDALQSGRGCLLV